MKNKENRTHASRKSTEKSTEPETSKADEFYRAPNEDDDGYDPYSDRPVSHEMWEEDPWK